MKKKIDVIIPAYNAEKFISRAINSVNLQTYLPEKIIVVDDGSDDSTVKVVESIEGSVPIILLSQENRGPNAARNKGLLSSDSEYVAFLDADDAWHYQKLEKQMEVFEKTEYDELGLVYTAYDLIDKNDNKIKQSFLVFKLDPGLRGNVFDKMFDAMKITGSCSGVLIRKNCFDKTGLFDEDLRGAEDWDMWIRIAREFQIDYVDEVLVHVRLHDVNSHNDQVMMVKNMLLLVKKWSKILGKDHPGVNELGEKSFDYFFKALFLLKIKRANSMIELYRIHFSKDEMQQVFGSDNFTFLIFLLLPKYFLKQIVRILNI